MADMNGPLIVQPPAPNTADAVRMFVMPERYRHGAVVNMVEPKTASDAQASTAVQPPVPPKPLSPLPAAAAITKPEDVHTKRGLLIAGGIVLVALCVSGYILLRSTQKNPPPAVDDGKVVTPVTQTPPVTEPPPKTTPTEPLPGDPSNPFPVAVNPGADTDSDGLTNVEEQTEYFTNPNLPDSDSDGFLDGNEVFHGYNPNGTAPGTLLLAGLVQELVIDGFIMHHPSAWNVTPAASGTGSVITAASGERIVVTVIQKDRAQALTDWLQEIMREGATSASKTRKGFPMLVTSNQLRVYVDLGASVVSLTYETSAKATVDYLQTFQMMTNSIELLK